MAIVVSILTFEKHPIGNRFPDSHASDLNLIPENIHEPDLHLMDNPQQNESIEPIALCHQYLVIKSSCCGLLKGHPC